MTIEQEYRALTLIVLNMAQRCKTEGIEQDDPYYQATRKIMNGTRELENAIDDKKGR